MIESYACAYSLNINIVVMDFSCEFMLIDIHMTLHNYNNYREYIGGSRRRCSSGYRYIIQSYEMKWTTFNISFELR